MTEPGEETNERPRGGRNRGGQSRRSGRGGGRGGGAPPNNHARPAPKAEAIPAAPTIQKRAGDEDADGEVCFICASPVVHYSVAPCNHRTCHICSLRLRALYKSKACAHCRTNADLVIFTDDPEKRFEAFTKDNFAMQDPVLGVDYEKQDIYEDTVLLLRYNCPDAGCDVACLGWPDLHRHVKSVHHRVMCDLCTRNKKVFTHEHELFAPQDLKRHEKFGDDNPGAVDQSGFRGHPECGFCRQRFYGDDELYTHCRDRHERCHLCDRRNGGRQPQYYLDYNALEAHFRKDHHMCQDRECLEKKFVVFDSEMDLKAHQLEQHPNGLTKDARRVDISGFDYREPHQEERRPGRGRGRGRDPNAEPIPQSSAQPMRRDELAYQRQMAIHSAQSVTARSFGGALTREAPAPRSTTPAVNPQEQARQLRIGALDERATALLHNEQNKLQEYRQKSAAFLAGTLTAQALIDSFFTLFDTSSAELGSFIKELADTFDQLQKRADLVKAWTDWRAINEDYPSLPGPSSNAKGAASGKTWASNLSGSNNLAAGSRVLKLKSSTTQSGRTAASRSLTTGNPFPPLSAAPTSRSRPQWFDSIPTGAPNTTSSKILTASSSTPASSAATSGRSTPAPVMSKPPGKLPPKDMFPSLPAAKKPALSVFSPGYAGSGVRRVNGSGAPSNAWGGAATTAAPDVVGADDAAGGKKKGKGKKQVLYNWG